jgi:hypothetical protein
VRSSPRLGCSEHRFVNILRVAFSSPTRSGHAAAAVVLGLGVERATIIPEGDCLGHVIVPVANDPDLAYYVDRAVMSWCGPLAEQRHLGAGVEQLGGDDREQIRADGDLVALGPYEADTFAQWTRARAMNLLAAHFPAVAALGVGAPRARHPDRRRSPTTHRRRRAPGRRRPDPLDAPGVGDRSPSTA